MLRPSPENEQLYRKVLPSDDKVQDLAESIRKHGLQSPIIATADGFIVSGHRRHCAAGVAKLATVPVLYLEKRRADYTDDEYLEFLREHNRQRKKSFGEEAREAIVDADPDEAYEALLDERQQGSEVDLTRIDTDGWMNRSTISGAKQPMVDAILRVFRDLGAHLPISVRTVHYQLAQHHRPLVHASKPDSTYGNNLKSYRACSELLTRMRCDGLVPHQYVVDETRPFVEWAVHESTGDFVDSQLDEFLKGYRRDLMASQPRHVHIAVEKNTAFATVKQVAGRYSIPCSSLRGEASTAAKHQIADSYRQSGKGGLVLLVVSDFDPTGESLASSLAKSIRDDFGVDEIDAYKVAVTVEQAEDLELLDDVQGISAKSGDSKRKAFGSKYGDDQACFEIEALDPGRLQEIVAESIDAVIDVDLLNKEREAEKSDAAKLQSMRERARVALLELADLGGDAA